MFKINMFKSNNWFKNDYKPSLIIENKCLSGNIS